MARARIAMRKIRDVLRLRFEAGLSPQQVSVAVDLPRTTVRRYLAKAAEAGVEWPIPPELDDDQLERRLFGTRKAPAPKAVRRPVPDWQEVHREYKRPGVTLQLLWMEYKERYPEGFQYSWFAENYRTWARKLNVVMRQEHRAGEKLFVDFAGQTVPITNPRTGQISQAPFFVAALGASSYTYAEATASQDLPSWISAHVKALEFYGGVPQIIVPDNPKVGITRADRYEPELQRTYLEFAAHYGCAIIPARPRKPRDKAKVEVAVQIAERWILARLRNRTFFSLTEANEAIGEQLEALNRKDLTTGPGSRLSLFEALDRPALRPLPVHRFEYATWKVATVSIDYHVEVNRHRYSVPYQLVGQQCEVRVSLNTVEVFRRSRRVASHRRDHRAERTPGGFTTDASHMPESHRCYLEWTPERLVRWGRQMGPATAQVVEQILRSRAHPQQGFRSCLGIFRLARRYDAQRLEAACRRAVALQAFSYRSIQSILQKGLDQQPLPDAREERSTRDHANVRGADYYQ